MKLKVLNKEFVNKNGEVIAYKELVLEQGAITIPLTAKNIADKNLLKMLINSESESAE